MPKLSKSSPLPFLTAQYISIALRLRCLPACEPTNQLQPSHRSLHLLLLTVYESNPLIYIYMFFPIPIYANTNANAQRSYMCTRICRAYLCLHVVKFHKYLISHTELTRQSVIDRDWNLVYITISALIVEVLIKMFTKCNR